MDFDFQELFDTIIHRIQAYHAKFGFSAVHDGVELLMSPSTYHGLLSCSGLPMPSPFSTNECTLLGLTVIFQPNSKMPQGTVKFVLPSTHEAFTAPPKVTIAGGSVPWSMVKNYSHGGAGGGGGAPYVYGNGSSHHTFTASSSTAVVVTYNEMTDVYDVQSPQGHWKLSGELVHDHVMTGKVFTLPEHLWPAIVKKFEKNHHDGLGYHAQPAQEAKGSPDWKVEHDPVTKFFTVHFKAATDKWVAFNYSVQAMAQAIEDDDPLTGIPLAAHDAVVKLYKKYYPGHYPKLQAKASKLGFIQQSKFSAWKDHVDKGVWKDVAQYKQHHSPCSCMTNPVGCVQHGAQSESHAQPLVPNGFIAYSPVQNLTAKTWLPGDGPPGKTPATDKGWWTLPEQTKHTIEDLLAQGTAQGNALATTLATAHYLEKCDYKAKKPKDVSQWTLTELLSHIDMGDAVVAIDPPPAVALVASPSVEQGMTALKKKLLDYGKPTIDITEDDIEHWNEEPKDEDIDDDEDPWE